MSRNQIWYFFRQNKYKSTWQLLGLLYLPYIHRKLKKTLTPCRPQVARFCFSFLWAYKSLNKLETCQLQKLVQHHQNMSTPLKEQIKVGAIFPAKYTTKIPIIFKSNDFAVALFFFCFFYIFNWKFALNPILTGSLELR